MIIEVTPVNEHMRLRICHSLDVISLVSTYAMTEASDLTVKDAFHAVLQSMDDQSWGIVQYDQSVSNGTDRDGYDTSVSPHGSESVNQNITKVLDFARIL